MNVHRKALDAIAQDIDFSLNMGEIMQVQARKSGREMTAADNKLFGTELRIPRKRVHTPKYTGLTDSQLLALQEQERHDRIAQLTQLAESIDFGSDDDESEGVDLCSLLQPPVYI